MTHTVRYLLSFGVPLVAAALLTPLAARLAVRLGIIDHPKEGRIHQRSTPYLGGLAVAAGLVLTAWLSAGAEGELLTILLASLALAGLGFVDDHRTVRPAMKFIVEAGAALALWTVGVRAGLFGVEVLDALLTVFWVVAITNAVNMLDNMDGLAAGVATVSAGTFALIAASLGDFLVASFALAIAGALVGFLFHNFPPARIFLGDGGTLMLGFLLAALGLQLDLVGQGGLVRSAIPVLVLGVFIFDMALVTLARQVGQRPLFRGGTDHSSHRLVNWGAPPSWVAGAAYCIQMGLSALAISLTGAASDLALTLVLAVGIAAVAALLALLRLPEPSRVQVEASR